MDATKEVKQALIHLRKVQTWLNKNSTTVTISKTFTWPKESKLLGLKTNEVYSYLDIITHIYKYIDDNELMIQETHQVRLDTTLKKILKIQKDKISIFELASHLKL